MAKRRILKLGDVFEIHLRDGRFCYCQYIAKNTELGFLIRVFDYFSTEPMEAVPHLDPARLLFPPVFVGLQATARSGRWKRIGNLPVEPFVFPHFRQTMGTKPGVYQDWQLWDGNKSTRIGKLPAHLRSLELECVWGDEGIEERIMAGTYRGASMF